jgi:hypothetical protein
MDMPKFNFSNLDVKSEKELETLRKSEQDAQSRFFAPGNYSLKVVAAELHKNKDTGAITCSDPTWFNVKLTLADANDRRKDLYLQVPTSTVSYQTRKGPSTFMFTKFQEVMAGLGVTVLVENLGTVVPKYFGDLTSLVGLDVNVDIGYDRKDTFAEKLDNGQWIIKAKEKIVLDPSTNAPVVFPDRNSAKAYAAETLGVPLSGTKVVKVNRQVSKQASDVSGW